MSVAGAEVEQPRDPAARAPDRPRPRRPQPGVGLADVPVLVGRRPAERLAPGAPGPVRHRRRRTGVHRGQCRHRRRTDLPRGRRHLVRRARRGVGPRRDVRPRPRRPRRHAAGARRPQGVDVRAVAGPRLRTCDRGRLAGGGPVGGRLRRLRRAPGALARRGRRAARPVRRGRRPRGGRRLRGARGARRARLPAAQLPVPVVQPARRRVRRQLREPHPAAGRDRRRGPRSGARRSAGLRTDLGDRLGRRRVGRRPERAARAGAARARRRPGGRVQRWTLPRPADRDRPRATRWRSPGGYGRKPGSRPGRSA